MKPAIQVNQLRRMFGDFVAVDNISFEVPQGQVFGFPGPNGSGKTTTIRMLLGLLAPTSGQAHVLGQSIEKNSRTLQKQLGYMSQKFSLYKDLTVLENLKFFGRGYDLRGKELQNRIDFVLDMAGLRGEEHIRTDELSGGRAQRLALGTAIMHRPKLIFLDEPTAGVDPVSRREFWDLLYDLSSEGTTIFITTHYMDEVERCESAAFMYYGKIIAHDTPQNIIHNTLPGQVVAFEPSDPPYVMDLLQQAIDNGELNAGPVSLFGAAVHVITDDVDDTRTCIGNRLSAQDILIDNLHIKSPSLEDAFIQLMNEADAAQEPVLA